MCRISRIPNCSNGCSPTKCSIWSSRSLGQISRCGAATSSASQRVMAGAFRGTKTVPTGKGSSIPWRSAPCGSPSTHRPRKTAVWWSSPAHTTTVSATTIQSTRTRTYSAPRSSHRSAKINWRCQLSCSRIKPACMTASCSTPARRTRAIFAAVATRCATCRRACTLPAARSTTRARCIRSTLRVARTAPATPTPIQTRHIPNWRASASKAAANSTELSTDFNAKAQRSKDSFAAPLRLCHFALKFLHGQSHSHRQHQRRAGHRRKSLHSRWHRHRCGKDKKWLLCSGEQVSSPQSADCRRQSRRRRRHHHLPISQQRVRPVQRQEPGLGARRDWRENAGVVAQDFVNGQVAATHSKLEGRRGRRQVVGGDVTRTESSQALSTRSTALGSSFSL